MSSLMRWNPVREMRQMERLLEDPFIRPFWAEGAANLALDMYETDNEIVVKLAAPGVKADDINVSITGNVLTVRGESKSEENVEEKDYILRERRFGKFSRSVTLPTSVDANNAKAEFEDGVLTLTVPKAEDVKPKSIQVKSKESSATIEAKAK